MSETKLPDELETSPYLVTDGEGYRKNELSESFILSEIIDRMDDCLERAIEWLGWRIQTHQCVLGWVKGIRRKLGPLTKQVRSGDPDGLSDLIGQVIDKTYNSLSRAEDLRFETAQKILDQFSNAFRQFCLLVPDKH